ncbi:MAG: PEGA domain-containing protein, partial [Sandaracinaceae bacterium]|nr:PEGA domain-containing protein [Sandaracinaceae bacterium]
MFRFAMFAGALSLATMSTLGVAHAQDDREAARVQFEHGVGLYEAHDYEGALAAFQEAYRLAPHPTVRVNMANCYDRLDRPIEAIHHFERFLAESPNAPRAQRREVEAAVTALHARVGEVRLAVAPDGARITIDDNETRRAPVLEPILMTTGEHTVVVAMDGYRTARETITVAGGDSPRVSIRLERGTDEPVVAAVTEPVADPVEPVETTGDPVETDPVDDTGDEATADASYDDTADDGGGFQLRFTEPVIIFGATTAALGVGAIITGALAMSYNSQFEDSVALVASTPPGPERRQARADGQSAADTANALSIVTDVLIIGTIAAAGATAFFVIIDGLRGDDDQEGTAQDGVRLMALPTFDANGGGVAL